LDYIPEKKTTWVVPKMSRIQTQKKKKKGSQIYGKRFESSPWDQALMWNVFTFHLPLSNFSDIS
jgi:hypothetical protein